VRIRGLLEPYLESRELLGAGEEEDAEAEPGIWRSSGPNTPTESVTSSAASITDGRTGQDHEALGPENPTP
jgi:hypothetical protein